MSQQPGQEPLVGEVRFNVPLPFVIPLIALGVIAAAAIGFSKVLLSLESEAAVIVATATAINLLGAAAFVALRPRVSSTSYMELLAIVAYPILIGVVIATVGIGEASGGHASGETPSPGTGADLTITALNTAFDSSELAFTAGEATTLALDNQDTADHNVAIYPTQADALDKANALFTGEIFAGPKTVTYDVPALDPGEYFFQCDVHPNMSGTATAT